MYVEFTKTVKKQVHLPPLVEIGDESFEIVDTGIPNELVIKFGNWETKFTIHNPEEFSKKPVEQVMLMIQSIYDDIHEYIISNLGDDEGTL